MPKHTKLLEQIKKDLDASIVNEKDERAKGTADAKFINGDQWPQGIAEQRKGRVKLTINKMLAFLDQIDGDLRQNKQAIKISASDSHSDNDTASVIEGLVRYIERKSSASRVYAYAGTHIALSGRGAWRILTDYVDEDTFTQEIYIQRIRDAFSVYYDPGAIQEDKQDGRYFFIVEDVSKSTFRAEYKREPLDFNLGDSSHVNWMNDDNVRIAEYFYKKEVEVRKLFLLADGSIKTYIPDGMPVIKERNIPVHEIWWTKVDGRGVLEGPQKIAGNMFPVVLIWGKELCIEGKTEVRGIARHAKDSQRMYNYWRSAHTELVALAPKQPYIIPDTVLGPHKTTWDNAANENYPYLLYTPDMNNPNLRPYKEQPTMPSPGMIQEIQLADRDLRDTVGMHKAALGMSSNETSGVAISKRQTETDTGQYAYIDNVLAGVRTSGHIIVNMIPDVYDMEGTIHILGEDTKEQLINLGEQNIPSKIYDLCVGKYDVAIDTGPSYATQREELVQKLQVLLPSLPQDQIAVITDILFESMDMPKANDIAERLKKLLPEGLLNEDEIVLSDEEREKRAQEEERQQQQQQMVQQLEQMKLQTEQMKLQTEQTQSQMDTKIAELKVQQEELKVQQKEVDLAIKEEDLSEQVTQALHDSDIEDTESNAELANN